MATKTKDPKAKATKKEETEKKGFAPFKQSADGYLTFGSKATELAEVLGMETTSIKNGASFMLKIELGAFEAAKAILEAANYDVKVEDMKVKVNVKTFNGGALVFGESDKEENAAALVAKALELEVKMTNSDRPVLMVRLTEEQLTQAIELLEKANYLVNILSDS